MNLITITVLALVAAALLYCFWKVGAWPEWRRPVRLGLLILFLLWTVVLIEALGLIRIGRADLPARRPDLPAEVDAPQPLAPIHPSVKDAREENRRLLDRFKE